MFQHRSENWFVYKKKISGLHKIIKKSESITSPGLNFNGRILQMFCFFFCSKPQKLWQANEINRKILRRYITELNGRWVWLKWFEWTFQVILFFFWVFKYTCRVGPDMADSHRTSTVHTDGSQQRFCPVGSESRWRGSGTELPLILVCLSPLLV